MLSNENKNKNLTDLPFYFSHLDFHFTDITPPTLTCPSDQVLTASKGQLTAVASWPDVTATDNSGIDIKEFTIPQITG